MINVTAEKNRVHEYMMEMSRHSEMSFQYDKEVTAGLVNVWIKKKRKAINFLSNMPTWDEETGTASFTVEAVKKAQWRRFGDEVYSWTDFITDKGLLPDGIDYTSACTYRYDLYQSICYDEHAGKVTDRIKDFSEKLGLKLHKGGKLNREFRNALLRKLKGTLNEAGEHLLLWTLAKMDEYAIETRTNEKWVISPLPSYILSQSHGNSWSSCHSILEGGCHAGGTLSYCNDTATMIAWKPSKGNEWWVKEKRVLVYLGKGNSLMACRCYPTYKDEDVESVLVGLQKYYGELKLKKSDGDISHKVLSAGDTLAYPDWNCQTNTLLYLDYCLGTKEVSDFWGTHLEPVHKEKFYVGGDAYCLKCGKTLDSSDGEQYINCSECADIEVWCYHCDHRVSRNEAFVIDGNYYCPHCVEVCADCGEGLPIHRLNWENDGGESICVDCSDNYTYCRECDRVIHYHNTFEMNGLAVCCYCYIPEDEDENEDEDIILLDTK